MLKIEPMELTSWKNTRPFGSRKLALRVKSTLKISSANTNKIKLEFSPIPLKYSQFYCTSRENLTFQTII
jgi:hypothetical protein